MAKHDDLVVVIGAGASGIIIAHTLKHRIGHSNFVILERTGSLGGTWSEEVNNYPGGFFPFLLLDFQEQD